MNAHLPLLFLPFFYLIFIFFLYLLFTLFFCLKYLVVSGLFRIFVVVI